MSVAVAGIGMGTSLIGGLIGAGSAKKAARRAARERARHLKIVNKLEANRQPIVNPYEGVKSVADMAVDLSNQVTNPFNNLSVATQATEIQMEESDQALANTLDTMLATGAGSGGATALAQAALKSKQGISADIEKQEVANEKLRAEGELQQEQFQLQEKLRIQGLEMSEAQRVQSAMAAGKQFTFNALEDRQNAKINRHAAMAGAAAQAEASAKRDQSAAITGMIGSLGSIGMSLATPSQ